MLARARDARGSGAPARRGARPCARCARSRERGYGEEEERQVERRTTTPHTQLCYQNCPGPGEWDQGDENTGVILLRSDMSLYLA